jgi:hypothetical protein
MSEIWPDRHELVLTWHRDEHLTFREIARRLGISGSRARQVYVAARERERYQRDSGNLSTRMVNCLRRAGLTLPETQKMSDLQLLRLRNFGVKTVREIRAVAPVPRADVLISHFDCMSAARLGGGRES